MVLIKESLTEKKIKKSWFELITGVVVLLSRRILGLMLSLLRSHRPESGMQCFDIRRYMA